MQYEEGEKVIDHLLKSNNVKLYPIKQEELKNFPKKFLIRD